MMEHNFNPSTWEAEAGRSVSSRLALVLYSEFQNSQALCRETLSQTKENRITKTKTKTL